jgi:hypothetical protein
MGPMHCAADAIEHANKHYLQDLEAMTEEQLLAPAGGSARTAVDFTYETALINRRVAARLAGTEPPAMPEAEGWLVAPSEVRNKAAIIEYMRKACEELSAAARAVPEAEGGKLVGPAGNERPAYDLAHFAAMHTMYHDAQLNFIQELGGDLEVHWN